MTAHRPKKTHKIRRVGTLSALDWLDIADEGGTKRGIIRADDSPGLGSSPKVGGEKKKKKKGRWAANRKKRKQAIMLLLIC